MKNLFAGLVLAILTVGTCCAQTLNATTESGRKVVLNADGTWKYASSAVVDTSQHLDDCDRLVVTEKDKMTDKVSTSQRLYIVNPTDKKGEYLKTDMKRFGTTIYLRFTVDGCVDENRDAIILFKDGTKLKLTYTGDFNCKGQMEFFLAMSSYKLQLEQLRTQTIDAVRVYTHDSYIDANFSESAQKDFHTVINCLMK